MTTKPKTEPIRLPPDIEKQLRNLTPDFDNSDRELAVMEQLGMDTRAVKEKLQWAKEVRKTLLREFTARGEK